MSHDYKHSYITENISIKNSDAFPIVITTNKLKVSLWDSHSLVPRPPDLFARKEGEKEGEPGI